MTAFALTVSIVCFRTPRRQVAALLESLALACARARGKLPLQEVEIYLVDNTEAGDNDSAELASLPSPEDCQLHLVRGHGNIGYGAAHNLALRQSGADYHLILNPDVEFDPDALAAGLDYLLANPAAVLASPAAMNDGEQQYLCKRYPSVLVLLMRGFAPAFMRAAFSGNLAAYEMRELPRDRPSVGIPIVSGCCMLCRGRPLRESGGFDERFFLYFEDFDLSLRLGRHGELAHVPAMRIRHGGGNAAGKGLRHIALFARSAWRFFNLHGWRWI